MDMNKLALIPLWLVPFIFSLSFHEFAHAWTANFFGDNTSKFMGRLSMNPKAHVDPIGTIAFPIISFLTSFPLIGWAKPVVINERNFKHPHREAMFVAIAGPASNILLAVCFTAIAHLINQGHSNVMHVSGFDQPLLMMALFGIQINVMLAFFNLIPIPPLDGSRVIRGLFPHMTTTLNMIERYGFLIMLFLLYSKLINVLLIPAHQIINVLMSLI